MNKLKNLKRIRQKLSLGQCSIGSWMQIPNTSIAEIMAYSRYDWVALDLEHGSMSTNQLPDLFRALELGGTLPFARLVSGSKDECKEVLDAGACGLIIPNINDKLQLEEIIGNCMWPPQGNRGVGFSRANLFGQNFSHYSELAQTHFMVAMIEHKDAIQRLDEIIKVRGLDAILIGPYDLSASMSITGDFNHKDFINAIKEIKSICKKSSFPMGIHIVDPKIKTLEEHIKEGFTFIPYSMDSVFLSSVTQNPKP